MTPRHTIPRNPVADKPKPESLADRWLRCKDSITPDDDLRADIDAAYRARRAARTVREAAIGVFVPKEAQT